MTELHDIPDHHGDRWVYNDRDANGVLRQNLEIHRSERAQNGFSEYDWWNFDTFIAEVIARAAIRFAEEGHCYFEDMGEDGTRDYYLGIARALMRYAQDDAADLNEERRVAEEAKAAMMRFAEHFTRWSD